MTLLSKISQRWQGKHGTNAGPRLPGAQPHRYLAQTIVREYPGTERGTVLAFSSLGPVDVEANVLLLLAYCLRDELGQSALVVDATLRSGGLTTMLGMDGAKGFVEAIQTGARDLNAVIRKSRVGDIGILPMGVPGDRPASIRHEQVASLFRDAASGYRYVLVHTGSVLDDTRHLVTAATADAAILMGAENATPMRTLDESRRLLSNHGIRDIRALVIAPD